MTYNITAEQAANFQKLVNLSQGIFTEEQKANFKPLPYPSQDKLDDLVPLEMLRKECPRLFDKIPNMNVISDVFRGFAKEGVKYDLVEKFEMDTLLAFLFAPLMIEGTSNIAEVILPILGDLQATFGLSNVEREECNRIMNGEHHCITF